MYSRLMTTDEYLVYWGVVGRTHVPVLPDRALEECSMSREVPKSDSIARGLTPIYQYSIKSKMSLAYIIRSSSQVNKTLPGFRSRCNIDLSCFQR